MNLSVSQFLLFTTLNVAHGVLDVDKMKCQFYCIHSSHVMHMCIFNGGGKTVIELLRTRRSVRKYERKPLSAEALDIVKEAVLRSPSGRGVNPWKFIFIDDKELLHKLSQAKEHGSSFLEGAALGIVVCGDETRTDVWIEDCSIAAIIIQLTAHSLGLGTCWIQIRNRFHNRTKTSEVYIQELLGIPGKVRVESIISIGYPAETLRPISKADLAYTNISHNRYD